MVGGRCDGICHLRRHFVLGGSSDARIEQVNPHSPDNALSFGAACAIQIYRSASYPGSSEAAMAHPRGESGSDAVRLDFDRRLILQFFGDPVTTDAGLLAYRELDDVLGLTEMAGDVLADARSGKNGRHALA